VQQLGMLSAEGNGNGKRLSPTLQTEHARASGELTREHFVQNAGLLSAEGGGICDAGSPCRTSSSAGVVGAVCGWLLSSGYMVMPLGYRPARLVKIEVWSWRFGVVLLFNEQLLISHTCSLRGDL